MRTLRARLVTFTAVAVAIVVIVAAGLAAKEWILERWCLHRLVTADGSEKEWAIEKLGEVGAEEALLWLMEYTTSLSPTFMNGMVFFSRSNPELCYFGKVVDMKELKQQQSRASWAGRSLVRIRDRIGETRVLAALARYVKDTTGEPRTRVWCAQMILGLLKVGEWNGPPLLPPEPHAPSESLRAAIAASIDLLESDDGAVKSGAAYALWQCGIDGQNVARALPALEKAAEDPRKPVRDMVTGAIGAIRSANQ